MMMIMMMIREDATAFCGMEYWLYILCYMVYIDKVKDVYVMMMNGTRSLNVEESKVGTITYVYSRHSPMVMEASTDLAEVLAQTRYVSINPKLEVEIGV